MHMGAVHRWNAIVQSPLNKNKCRSCALHTHVRHVVLIDRCAICDNFSKVSTQPVWP